eukprot:289942-Rhodomonas_salina.2
MRMSMLSPAVACREWSHSHSSRSLSSFFRKLLPPPAFTSSSLYTFNTSTLPNPAANSRTFCVAASIPVLGAITVVVSQKTPTVHGAGAWTGGADRDLVFETGGFAATIGAPRSRVCCGPSGTFACSSTGVDDRIIMVASVLWKRERAGEGDESRLSALCPISLLRNPCKDKDWLFGRGSAGASARSVCNTAERLGRRG